MGIVYARQYACRRFSRGCLARADRHGLIRSYCPKGSGKIRAAAVFGPLSKQYEGIDVHDYKMPGDVEFVYHTYHGFVAFFIQTEHRVRCPSEQALVLLRRFLRFNLTWGLLSYGMLFVPFLAYFNYLAQKRSIKKQQRQLIAGPSPHSPLLPVDPDNPYAAPQGDGQE